MAVETDTHGTGERSDGVGSSTCAESAGRAAVLAALNGRTPAVGDLVLLFATAEYDIEELYRDAAEAAAPAEVAGCTSMGSFTHAGFVNTGCVAAYLPADRVTVGICHVERDDADIAGSARRAAQTARARAGAPGAHSVLVILSDGLTPDQREVARGAYEVTGARIPFVGGAAADALQWTLTHTFGGGRVLSNGLLAIWLNSDEPLTIGVGHGWRPTGRPMLVTRTEGTIVQELDGRPALEAYLAEVPIDITGEEPEFFQLVLEHPVGIPNGASRYDVRQLHAYLPPGGGVNFNTGVSEHSILQVMGSDSDSLMEGAREATAEAAARRSTPPTLAIVFSCGSRVPLLGERIADEAQVISDTLGGAPVCGFFTYGEFARVDGSSGVHNSSVAVLVL
jgi:hypothetical protein